LALDGRLRFDTAVYLYAYNNFRTISKMVPTDRCQCGQSNSYGVETAVDWMAFDWADIFATYAYSHARFGGDSFYKAICSGDAGSSCR